MTVATPSDTVDEYLQVPPAPALRRYVGWYSGYRQRGMSPEVHRGLPSPYLTLIFTLDEPLIIAAHPDPAQQAGSYDTLLGGLHRTPALITHDGAQSGVQVTLSPLGSRRLFGLPAGELANLDLPVDDVLGGFGARVRGRLLDAGTWPARFAVLDELLTARILDGRHARSGPPAEVVRAWDVVLRSQGTVTAAALASEIGWSARHLRSRFQQEVGLTPKLAARVVRFDRARRVLQASAHETAGGMGLADLAAGCGYADQAHLARDFREMSGCSPSGWLAAEFRNVQAGPGPDVERWTDG